jgi:soluble lytic murein transglycosylase
MRLVIASLILLLGLSGAVAAEESGEQPRQQAVADARAALKAADRRDFDKARLLAARSGLPLLEKVVVWTEMTRPEPGGDFGQSAAFIKDNPRWPWQWNMRRRAERAIGNDTDSERIVAWFENYPPLTNEGVEAWANALIDLGRKAEGRSTLEDGWVTGVFNVADERRMIRRLKGTVPREREIERLENLLWAGHAVSARRQATRLGGSYPHYAEARIALSRMSPGVDGRIAQVPAEMRKLPGFVFDRALWRLRKDRYEDVMALLDPPDASLPRAERWWTLRHWAARKALERGDITAARRIAANHGLDAGIGFAQGEWLAGWISLRFLGEAERGLNHFERMYSGVSTPVSRARAAYWAGRAAESLGNEEAALAWFNRAAENSTTFYGQLAADKAKGRFNVILDAVMRPADSEKQRFEQNELVRVVRLLSRLNEQERLEPFFHELRQQARSGSDYHLVAALGEDIDRADLAVSAARYARRDRVILSDHLYPLPGGLAREIQETAQAENHPDPALLLSIVRQESGFDEDAVSGAGARGLMQLMPATAKAVARKLKVGYSRDRLLNDPEYNLQLGRAYLAHLVERYDGSSLLAVAAYNAGPGNVAKWIATYGDPRTDWVDPIDWIESVPFEETRNYIQRIFESIPVYRQRMLPSQVAMMVSPELRHSAP